MPNDQLEALRAEFSAKSEKRDDQLRQVERETAAFNENFIAIEARLAATERSPGIITIISASIGMAAILGSAFTFVLAQQDKVQVAIHVGLDQRIGAVERLGAQLNERQDDVRQRLSRLEGVIPEMSQRMNDMDQMGSRKLVDKD